MHCAPASSKVVSRPKPKSCNWQFCLFPTRKHSFKTLTIPVLAHTTVGTTSREHLVDRIIASRNLTAALLAELFVSRQKKKVSFTVAAAHAEGADKDAMEKGNRSGRQPLFPKDREYLRL